MFYFEHADGHIDNGSTDECPQVHIGCEVDQKSDRAREFTVHSGDEPYCLRNVAWFAIIAEGDEVLCVPFDPLFAGLSRRR